MAEEFTPIETQEALDEIINARLTANTAVVTDKVTKSFDGYISPDDLAAKTSELTGKIQTLESENAAYRTAALKTKIAAEAGLPQSLADRLTGDDEEALKADAGKLAKLFAHRPAPPLGGTEKKDKNSDFKALLDGLEI